jgi:hypothetical protein
MSPTPVPTRITIDFRAAIHPSRAWILGLGASDRADLLAFDAPASRLSASSIPAATDRVRPTALSAPCACPDFCERDHPNE